MFNVKALFLIALAGFAAADRGEYGSSSRKPRNFIMVIPDGFGPASETMARDYVHWTNNATVTLPIDEMVIGQIRTKAADSYVTDSSSSATAYSCGIKTNNGVVGTDPELVPYGTVLEAAHLQGFKTGLIVTSRITHATPASYVSHVWHRDEEANIALQTIGHAHPLGRTVDLLLGGGRCYFTPKSTPGSCRSDDIDALALARNAGYTVFADRKAFDARPRLPYLGLFTQDHMAYEIDRDPAREPSLKEMALRGLNDLHAASRRPNRGFFVMIEASRIDHAGHANDPVGHLHDILAFNDAMAAIRTWIDEHGPDETVLISTADHECGGLTLGQSIPAEPDYWFNPAPLAAASASSGAITAKWKAYDGTTDAAAVTSVVFRPYGIPNPTNDEIRIAREMKGKSGFEPFLTKALSDRAMIRWSTGGHTGVDVTLYGHGEAAREFAGNRENTEVFAFVKRMLGLDVESVTRRLRANQTWVEQWVLPKEGEVRKRGLGLGGHLFGHH